MCKKIETTHDCFWNFPLLYSVSKLFEIRKEENQSSVYETTLFLTQYYLVMDKTLTPSPWTTQMDYPKMD